MVVDRAQEALAIGFEFLRPDAGELAQRGECGGPRTGHLAQRRIVEDDIGRHLRLFGELLAQRAQRLEQWIADRIGSRIAAAAPLAAAANQRRGVSTRRALPLLAASPRS